MKRLIDGNSCTKLFSENRNEFLPFLIISRLPVGKRNGPATAGVAIHNRRRAGLTLNPRRQRDESGRGREIRAVLKDIIHPGY